jgi:hypothetical protein
LIMQVLDLCPFWECAVVGSMGLKDENGQKATSFYELSSNQDL